MYHLDSFLLSKAQQFCDRFAQLGLSKYTLQGAAALISASAYWMALVLDIDFYDPELGRVAFMAAAGYTFLAIAGYLFAVQKKDFFLLEVESGFVRQVALVVCVVCAAIVLPPPFRVSQIAWALVMVSALAWVYISACEPYPRSRSVIIA